MPRNLGLEAFSFSTILWIGALWHRMALPSSEYTLPHVKHLYLVRAMSLVSPGETCIAPPVMKFSLLSERARPARAQPMCFDSAALASAVSWASWRASISSSSAIDGGSLRNTGM